MFNLAVACSTATINEIYHRQSISRTSADLTVTKEAYYGSRRNACRELFSM
jgi:hypothetical protein